MVVMLQRRAFHNICCFHLYFAFYTRGCGGGGLLALTRVCLSNEITGRHRQSGNETLKAERREAFQNYIRNQSSEYTGTHMSTIDSTSDSCYSTPENGLKDRQGSSRHVLETIEVRPLRDSERYVNAEETSNKRREKKARRCQQPPRREQSSPVYRGQRDIYRLRQDAANHISSARQKQLLEEYNRAVIILRDVLHVLKATLPFNGKERGENIKRIHSERLSSTEEIRFERLHQLRDTTNRLSTAHFSLLSNSTILEFLELIGRIVRLLQQPHTTAYGYVVRQAVRALSLTVKTTDGMNEVICRREPFLGHDYYKLLHAILLLPSSETIEVMDIAGRVMPVEELCVRQLSQGASECTLPNSFLFLHEIGPTRAVRVVTWCLHSAVSKFPMSSSYLPLRGTLRIPFGVGKEYAQCVLAAFAHSKTSPTDDNNDNNNNDSKENRSKGKSADIPFDVRELATLCNAIVFYEITTMEALQVLVEAAPACAVEVDELSGHQLSCVMLAYARLNYHGDLSRHPRSIYTSYLAKHTQQTNFYLLLGERAGELGESLHEDDAARVLRALVMAGVGHEGLRRSLESSMRMKRLHRRVIC